MRLSLLRTAFVLVLASLKGFAQSDADKFAEGKAALEKFNDCASARRAFESESPSARESAAWLDYAARAAECAGDLVAALDYYQREAALLPGSDFLSDKIGELRYQVRKQQETQQAATLRQQQDTALRQQQAAQIAAANTLRVQLSHYGFGGSANGTLTVAPSGVSWREAKINNNFDDVPCGDITFTYPLLGYDTSLELRVRGKKLSFASSADDLTAVVNAIKHVCSLR